MNKLCYGDIVSNRNMRIICLTVVVGRDKDYFSCNCGVSEHLMCNNLNTCNKNAVRIRLV